MKNIFIQKSCNIGNISKVDLIDLSLMMTLDSLDRYENNEQKSLNCLRYLFAYENNIHLFVAPFVHLYTAAGFGSDATISLSFTFTYGIPNLSYLYTFGVQSSPKSQPSQAKVL